MIVLDALAAVEWRLQTAAGRRIEHRIYSRNESLHVPHLFDIEIAHARRRLERDGAISLGRAAYVALSEELGAPLITRDLWLASAKGHAAKIEVVP